MVKSYQEPLILLTACINPGGMSLTVLQNPVERKKQYIDALNFYLEKTNCDIVFCENSNSCFFDEIFAEAIRRGRLEFLFFSGNHYPVSLGKGRGEAEIIRYALGHSKLLGKHDYFFKITGRHIINNIGTILKYARLLSKSPKQKVLFTTTYNPILSRSECIWAHKNFWQQYFLPRTDELDDSHKIYFEHLLFSAIQNWYKDGSKAYLLPFEINYTAISGSTNKPYAKTRFSILHRLLFPVRQFIIWRKLKCLTH